MKAPFLLLMLGSAALGQNLTTEGVTTTPGITEVAMRTALSRVTPSIESCVPQMLPEVSELDDRATIHFWLDAGGQLQERRSYAGLVEVNGLLDPACVVEQSKQWKFPKPNTGESVEVKWSLRVKVDPARSKELWSQAKSELVAYCEIFKKRLRKSPKSREVVDQALVEFLGSLGLKEKSGDAAQRFDLSAAKLTPFGRMWVYDVLNINPGDQGTIAASAYKEAGVKCPELAAWRFPEGK